MKPFSEIRVVELAQYVMVPSAGAMLADMGAEVIKVESPGTGDPYRNLVVDTHKKSPVNFSMEQNNRGKKSIAIDLKHADGRDVFMRLIGSADVFITSLRPAALQRLAMAPDDLRAHNKRLIYARANGYGFRGPDSERPGFDASAFWARGGFAHMMSSTVGQFVRQPRALGDHAASVSLAFGIASALFHRGRTGEGGVVETSLLAMASWMLSNDIVASQDEDYADDVLERAVLSNPLLGTYETGDGRWIQFALLEADRYWPQFCRVIDREDLIADSRFLTAKDRATNGRELLDLLAGEFRAKSWHHWREALRGLDAPWELVQSIQDIWTDEQVAQNGMLFETNSAEGTSVTLVSSPVTLGGTPADVVGGAPSFGSHTEAILTELGFDEAELRRLRGDGAVG